jgi:hypothetical protein
MQNSDHHEQLMLSSTPNITEGAICKYFDAGKVKSEMFI